MSDDYYVRLHRARLYFLAYRVGEDAWRLGSQLIELCLRFRDNGVWLTTEADLATLTYMELPAFLKAARKLKEHGVIRREQWVGQLRYEVRPHQEWKRPMSWKRWWKWARAHISVRSYNPAHIGAYRYEWAEVAGKEAAQHSMPVRRVCRLLHVACDSEEWRDWLDHEPRRKKIIRRLRVAFGEISRIQFAIGQVPGVKDPVSEEGG